MVQEAREGIKITDVNLDTGEVGVAGNAKESVQEGINRMLAMTRIADAPPPPSATEQPAAESGTDQPGT